MGWISWALFLYTISIHGRGKLFSHIAVFRKNPLACPHFQQENRVSFLNVMLDHLHP
ncbi:hypothetical protein Mapa_015116 [Marchantia paleacea]|nr:hypothetical protein Mapa_015116 [Marchantia paleacea]